MQLDGWGSHLYPPVCSQPPCLLPHTGCPHSSWFQQLSRPPPCTPPCRRLQVHQLRSQMGFLEDKPSAFPAPAFLLTPAAGKALSSSTTSYVASLAAIVAVGGILIPMVEAKLGLGGAHRSTQLLRTGASRRLRPAPDSYVAYSWKPCKPPSPSCSPSPR